VAVTSDVLNQTVCTVEWAPVLEYRKVLGLKLPAPDEIVETPAVVPFNPELRDDAGVIAALGLDFSRTLALGIDIDSYGAVYVGDRLVASTRVARDETVEGNRIVDVETSFRREDALVRSWTLHLIERGAPA
jgi:hypothetical protein